MIDTHTHLFVEEFKDDLPEVMDRIRSVGITKVCMPNIDDTTVEDMLRVCEEYKGLCYPMIGFHPTSVDANYAPRLKEVRKWLEGNHSFVGIGEVGLDLYWDKTYLKEQQLVLDEQVQWALEYDLPLIIHCREAFPELFEVLAPYKETPLNGIFHSFTGTREEAEQLLEYENFMLGINGVVTFKKSHLPASLRFVPLERVVLETDSPYLAPVPHRGKRNESAFVIEVAKKLAEIYEKPIHEIEAATTKNALKVFKKLE